MKTSVKMGEYVLTDGIWVRKGLIAASSLQQTLSLEAHKLGLITLAKNGGK